MRKLLLCAMATTAVAGAFALNPAVSSRTIELNPHSRNVASRAINPLKTQKAEQPRMIKRAATTPDSLSMKWRYCEGLWNAFPMNDETQTESFTMKGAIIMPAELATEYAGATLSAISLGTPIDSDSKYANYETGYYEYKNPIKNVTVWLADSINGEPFLSADGILSEDGFQWSTVDLPTPHTVVGGKDLVIGFTMEIPANKGNIMPLVSDWSYDVSEYSCWAYTNYTGMDENWVMQFGGDYKWQDMSADYGNIGISATLSGDMLPYNEVRTSGWSGSAYAAPGEEFNCSVNLLNLGANDIESVEFTMEIEGMEPQTCTAKVAPALPFFEIYEGVPLTFKCTTIGNNIGYKCYMTAINGEKLAEPGRVFTGSLLCISEGYPKNNVFEEGTGTWCGWCVVGYAGMEYMAEHYADQGFIGVAVHNGDPMEVMSEGCAFESFSSFMRNFPCAFPNRDKSKDLYPSPNGLSSQMNAMKDIPAYVKIDATVTATDDPRVLKLSTATEFSEAEEEANYMVAYTVLEDAVGPYMQANYASGSDYDYYGFEDEGEYVRLRFNDVARNCSKPLGIEGSLPAVTKKGETYRYDTEITLDDVKNLNKVRVVAMIVNGNNGTIENAVCLESPAYSGINKVTAASTTDRFVYGAKGQLNFRVNPAKANVYTMDGRRVAAGVKGMTLELPAGIYLVELNGKCAKVAVR